MSKRRSGDTPLTAVEQLSNVYESLVDDIFDAPSETDEVARQRAVRIFDAAVNKATTSTEEVKDLPPPSPNPPKSCNVDDQSEPKPTGALASRPKQNWRERWFKLHPASAVLLSICWLGLLLVWLTGGFAIPIEIVVGLITTFVFLRLEADRIGGNVLLFTCTMAATAFLVVIPIPIGPLVFFAAAFRDREARNERAKAARASSIPPVENVSGQSSTKPNADTTTIDPLHIPPDGARRPEKQRRAL